DVYIADQGNNRVLQMTPNEQPTSITQALGHSLVAPNSVAVDSNGTLVINTGLANEAYAGVLTINPAGAGHFVFGPGYNDTGVAVPANGTVYAADTGTPGSSIEPNGALYRAAEPQGSFGFAPSSVI